MKTLPRTLACIGALAIVALSTSQAQASDEPASEERPTVPAKSYGWQTAVVDGSSTALVAASLAGGSASVLDGVRAVGLAGFAFGGPLVHWSHGQVATGFASLGLRLAAPLIAWGAYAGTYALIKSGRDGGCGDGDNMSNDHCESSAWAVAAPVAVVGVAGVMVFDALVLAKEPAQRATSRSSARTFGTDLSPSVQLGADRAALTVSGTLF